MTAPAFGAVAAVLSYIGARGAAPEDDVLCVLAAREEEHRQRAEEQGLDVDGRGSALAGVRLLADLVAAGRLRRDDDASTYALPSPAEVALDKPLAEAREEGARAERERLAGRVARRFRDTHLMPPETGPDLLDQIDEILRSTPSPAIDTRMGCVERAVVRRRAGT